MEGSAFSASGMSVMSASVVSSRDAIDAAFCRATRSTLVGSMIPACIMSTYSLVSASKPRVMGMPAFTFSTTTEPSSPAFSTIWRIGSSSARRTMLTPVASSPESLRLPRASDARSSATGVVEFEVLELDPEVFRDRLASGHGRDVLEHGLAAITEARRLDGADGERPAELVDDQGRQRLAFQVLGDDQKRPAGLDDLFQ